MASARLLASRQSMKFLFPVIPISISQPQLRVLASRSRPGARASPPIDPALPQLLRAPRPLPAPLEPSPPLDPASMPSPPVAAAAAEVAAERPLPRMTRIKLLFPRAVKGLFGGVNRAWGVALVGFHAVVCVVKVVSFTTDPEVARFWVKIFRAWLYLFLAAVLLIMCVRIYYYCSLADTVKDNLPEMQLPPPPPEMDMC